MDIQFIRMLPIPACSVSPEGIITGANPLMKNVFVYDDIVGTNFFTMTGFKRDQLMQANAEEMVLERNDKLFKLWINEEAKSDEDIVVFFDEATARESFKNKLESERAVIMFINIDNYESHDTREIIEGVTFSLEPGIYAPDFGMRSETNVYIKDRQPIYVAGHQEEIIPVLK